MSINASFKFKWNVLQKESRNTGQGTLILKRNHMKIRTSCSCGLRSSYLQCFCQSLVARSPLINHWCWMERVWWLWAWTGECELPQTAAHRSVALSLIDRSWHTPAYEVSPSAFLPAGNNNKGYGFDVEMCLIICWQNAVCLTCAERSEVVQWSSGWEERPDAHHQRDNIYRRQTALV